MILTINRFGPRPQRFLKGYLLSGSPLGRLRNAAGDALTRAVRETGGQLVEMESDRRNPRVLWLDSGFVWMHTAAARKACFEAMARSVELVANAVANVGGQLLPNATRLTVDGGWEPWLCGDRHFLQVLDEHERERFCNLLRQHLPEIISFTGRGGVDSHTVDDLGSRRLFDSPDHAAARHFAAATPRYLERMANELRRDAGISHLRTLDVNPNPKDSSSAVELRFIDGQALLTSVRAQAILFQAMRLRAHRLVHADIRLEYLEQALVERNRARAIAGGPRAWIEQKPVPWMTRGSRSVLRAREALLALVEGLRYEFQVLEVDYPELAPLVVGSGLRQLGLPAVETENDLFRFRLRSQLNSKTRWPAEMASLLPCTSLADDLTAHNERRLPQQTRYLEEYWTRWLRNPSSARLESRRARTERSDQAIRMLAEQLASRRAVGGALSLLYEFVRQTTSQDLSGALRALPPERQRAVREYFFPPREQRFSVRLDALDWNEQEGRRTLDCARRRGVALLMIEEAASVEAEVDEAAAQLHARCPRDFDLFQLNRFTRRSGSDRTEESRTICHLLLVYRETIAHR